MSIKSVLLTLCAAVVAARWYLRLRDQVSLPTATDRDPFAAEEDIAHRREASG
jgi:hypothetical protein